MWHREHSKYTVQNRLPGQYSHSVLGGRLRSRLGCVLDCGGGFYYIEKPLIKGVSRLNRLWSILILFVFLIVLLCFVCSVLCNLKQRHPQNPLSL